MKVLITGGSGFVGKNLIKAFVEKKITVIAAVHKNTNLHPEVIQYKFDLSNPEKDIKFLESEKVNGVVHLATYFIAEHKSKDIKPLVDANILFGAYILECAAAAKINWFLNTGTYWQNYQNAKYSPVNLYAATKQAFQTIAQYYIEIEKIKFVTLKLPDTYGSGDTRPKILNLFNRIAITGEVLDMSPGEQLIDICHIDDIVRAFYRLAELMNSNKIDSGSAYEVKAAKRYTLKEIALIYEKTSGKKLNINWGRMPYREREVIIPWENGKVVPGWCPKITLEEGISYILQNEKR